MRYFLIALICVFICSQVRAQTTQTNPEFKFIQTNLPSTLEKELNLNAKLGWRVHTIPDLPFQKKLGALLFKSGSIQKYEYLVLAAARHGTLDQEFKDATKLGFELCGVATIDIPAGELLPINPDKENLFVLERELSRTAPKKEYLILRTRKFSTSLKEMNTGITEGFYPEFHAIADDNSIKQNIPVANLALPESFLTVLSRNISGQTSESNRPDPIRIQPDRNIKKMYESINNLAKEGYSIDCQYRGGGIFMSRPTDKTNNSYEYKPLRFALKSASLLKNFNEIGSQGYACNCLWYFEKKLNAPTTKYEYRFIFKSSETSINEEINAQKTSGFVLIQLVNSIRFIDAFGPRLNPTYMLIFQKTTSDK
jgi:hypothetical protein